MPAISIIIPTLNEEHYLPILLQSIVNQSYDGTYEVIIVDGGSKDKTRDVALRFKKSIPSLSFYSHKRGISRQRNYGATKARFNSIVFLDSDTLLPPNSLKKINQHYEKRRDFVAIPVLLPYDGKPIDFVFAFFGYVFFLMVKRTNPVVTGMCVITTKKVHDKVGGFDEQLEYAEDIDYGFRIVRAGFPHHIFFNTTVKSSSRRVQKIGRIKLGLEWLKWHRVTVKHGAAALQGKRSYEFGGFEQQSKK